MGDIQRRTANYGWSAMILAAAAGVLLAGMVYAQGAGRSDDRPPILVVTSTYNTAADASLAKEIVAVAESESRKMGKGTFDSYSFYAEGDHERFGFADSLQTNGGYIVGIQKYGRYVIPARKIICIQLNVKPK